MAQLKYQVRFLLLNSERNQVGKRPPRVKVNTATFRDNTPQIILIEEKIMILQPLPLLAIHLLHIDQ